MRPFSDLTLRDWAPLLPLIVLMVWLGSYTQSFMRPITSATMRILEQTRMNDEYRVRLILPAAPHSSVQIEKVADAR